MVPATGCFHDLVFSYSLKLIVDIFSTNSLTNYKDFIYPIGLFLGYQLLEQTGWRVGMYAEWKSEPYVRKDITLKAYDYVQHHSYRFFQDTTTGSISSKLQGLVNGYDNLWSVIQYELTYNVVSAFFYTISLYYISHELFAFVGIWCLILILVSQIFSKKLMRFSFAQSESKHKAFGIIADTISNIFSLFSFASRKYEHNKVNQFFNDDFIPKQAAMYKHNFIFLLISGTLYMLMITGVFVILVYLRQNNIITTGDVVFAATITLTLSSNLWHATEIVNKFVMNLGDLKSSYEILVKDQDLIDKPNAAELKVDKGEIEFKDLVFSYDNDSKIFNGLSLKIKHGERIGIVGLSGAGKSTLVSILLKYFRLGSGSVLIDGQDTADVDSDSLRRNISLIPQDIMLFHRNIFENIQYGNINASVEEVIAAAKKANIHDYITKLEQGYQTLVGERGVKLSGGQRQRIAIARAILKNAPILILDEATSSLDTETERLIQNSINDMLDNSGATVIAIAHRLSTLKHMDRIIVLDKGKIAEQGTHDSLIADKGSLYAKLWEMQQI